MTLHLQSNSYPPPFRRHSPVPQPQPSYVSGSPARKLDDDSGTDPIPVVDLGSLDQGELREACRGWGLFRLVNHGVPQTLLTMLQEHVGRLFSLPFEAKQQGLFGSPLSYFWGTPALTPSGSALGMGPGQDRINWVEGLNAPLGQLSQLRAHDPLLASFRDLLQEYGAHLGRIATSLFPAMAEDLGLDQEQKDSYLSESTGFVRVYRYPCCPTGSGNNNWGMDVHTDSSVLTILCQDLVGGLEVSREGEWIRVRPIPGTLIVNLGDMMQAISNDEYKSAIHRVRISERHDRISIGYFVFPGEGVVIRSSNYQPFKYSEFRAQVQMDVKMLGFKVGLERFKIKPNSDDNNNNNNNNNNNSKGISSHFQG
ncbi:gibberellin 2-beta-dioxygenase 6 [Punica granatum]|uniref:Gibberellin 2-beta-dioxygenase 6 n=2 Tax=Punica granatum TaxID=22663 RepID=A0A218W2J5_PUNGR|nr:gibberellin 2-beta-dioxygenase 6 [Punica granatum]OWM66688.1 hypothetical protein CDL15_Pgr010339 [Punica granatum]